VRFWNSWENDAISFWGFPGGCLWIDLLNSWEKEKLYSGRAIFSSLKGEGRHILRHGGRGAADRKPSATAARVCVWARYRIYKPSPKLFKRSINSRHRWAKHIIGPFILILLITILRVFFANFEETLRQRNIAVTFIMQIAVTRRRASGKLWIFLFCKHFSSIQRSKTDGAYYYSITAHNMILV